mmetsp:Transcript_20889/g.32225  ORF Transcript_20889/g.32225 Transcript_20889/m.32225 type:complete len:197 (+) Transcript_20889:142-732(+)
MEFTRVMIRLFPRRLCSSNVVGRTSSITHQRRALSMGFSKNCSINHRGLYQQNIHIRHFSKKDLNGDNSNNKQEDEEGDEIITIINGDRPDYESTSDTSKYTHEVKVEMPDIGDLKGGTIEKWYKQPGDIIYRDDIICDIRTESFTFGMVTDDDFDSMMGKILVEEESGMVDPGTVIFTTFSEDKHHCDDGDKKDE